MFKTFKIFIYILFLTIFVTNDLNISAEHLDEFDGEFKLSGQIVNGTSPSVDTNYEIKLMATQNSSSELIDIEIINISKNYYL